MLRRLFYIGIFVMIACSSSAQVHKKFYNKNGKVTKDSAKAVAYVLYRKEGPDSLWSAVLLNMYNLPMVKGTYLDKYLQIPYGKFTYYKPFLQQSKTDAHASTIDTVFKVTQTGFFINGLKEGVWLDYYPNGNKHYSKTYENDQLNGPAEEYYGNGKIYTRGTLIKGLKEGDWYLFRPDSTLKYQTSYHHNNEVHTEVFGENDRIDEAYPGFDFSDHIYTYINKLGIQHIHGVVIIAFIITEDGKLLKPQILMGLDPIFDEAVMEAVINSPAWYPARKNGKPIQEKHNYTFRYDSIRR